MKKMKKEKITKFESNYIYFIMMKNLLIMDYDLKIKFKILKIIKKLNKI